MKTHLNRIKRIEVAHKIDGEELWLAHFNTDGTYSLTQSLPMKDNGTHQNLTVNEFGAFKRNLKGQVVQVVWVDE